MRLIALCGALIAQYQGFADVQMGIGMVVLGIASVIIGEALVGSRAVGLLITGTVMGSVLFRLLVAIALRWGLSPNDLKLITAIFVFGALVMPDLGRRYKTSRMKSRQLHSAETARGPCSRLAISPRRSIPARPMRFARSRRFTYVAAGSFLIVLGTNGSGKSHAAQRRCRHVHRRSGSVAYRRQNITSWPEHRRAKLVGRVFQDPFSGTAPTMSIAENLVLASRRGKRRGLGYGRGPPHAPGIALPHPLAEHGP